MIQDKLREWLFFLFTHWYRVALRKNFIHAHAALSTQRQENETSKNLFLTCCTIWCKHVMLWKTDRAVLTVDVVKMLCVHPCWKWPLLLLLSQIWRAIHKKIARLTAREREIEKPWQNKIQTTASHSADFLLPVAESTKDKLSADKSFMRSWSRSDGQMANTLRSSTNSAPTPETTPAFERGKYKSDGEDVDQFCSRVVWE